MINPMVCIHADSVRQLVTHRTDH